MKRTDFVYLPARATALNLATVTHIEFDVTTAIVWLPYAESDDADCPEVLTAARLLIHGADVDALRAALGLPTLNT